MSVQHHDVVVGLGHVEGHRAAGDDGVDECIVPAGEQERVSVTSMRNKY